jgi:hypothetical protein
MSTFSRDKKIENAISHGISGAALGAMLTGKSKKSIIASLVGTAIGASITAQEEAKELEQALLYEDEGTIFRVYPDGHREVVKKLIRPNTNIPRNFKLI